ncbi:hypothetical protein CUMW_104440 [Citrus unshiu]|nr:hypothetical protein CUMW_104440 [Citrus unshiu]
MAILIPFFQQVTGINVISFYAPVLFRTINLSESTSLLMSAIVTGGVGAISTILSMILADRLGRKVLFLVGGIQMLVSQVMIGSIMAAQLGDHGGFSSGYAYLILVLVCVYTTGFAYSWGPLGWLVPSEIFPLEIRSAGQSITVAVGLLFTFLVAQTFLAMLCHFKAGIFFFFGGWVAFMTTFVHFFLPETKNLPIEQMDKLWAEHWFWRRIVGEGVEDNMAVGLAFTSEGGGQYYNGKMTPFVVLSCIVAATGGLTFGYDLGISGGVTSMEPFLKKFFPEVYKNMREDTKVSNYCKFNSQLLTTFTSSPFIAGLIASLFASKVTRALGRKASILVGGVAFLAGSALGGAAFNSVPLYLSEMAPPNHRQSIQHCASKYVLPLRSSRSLIFLTTPIPKDQGRLGLENFFPFNGCRPCFNTNTGALILPEHPTA